MLSIVDLAKAHVAALRRIQTLKEAKEEPRVEVYNIGTGKGYSVKEMVAAFEKACGHKVLFDMVILCYNLYLVEY